MQTKICKGCGKEFQGKQVTLYCEDCSKIQKRKACKKQRDKRPEFYNGLSREAYKRTKKEFEGISTKDINDFGITFLRENPDIAEALKIKNALTKETAHTEESILEMQKEWGRKKAKENKEKKVYTKNCPICGKEQVYSTKHLFEKSVRENKPCHACTGLTEKECVDCGTTILAKYNQIRCKDCQIKFRAKEDSITKKANYVPKQTVKICVDCGVEITKNVQNRVRCVDCSTKHRKQQKIEYMKEYNKKRN